MSQSTPISQLIQEREEEVPQFGQMPMIPEQAVAPVTNQQPVGVGQGYSAPSRKEFFGNFDWKNVLVVFAIILLVCSGIFFSLVRKTIPGSFASDNSLTLLCSIICAVFGTLLYIILKTFVINK